MFYICCTFYQKLVKNEILKDKINLMTGTVSYNNDGVENHIWISVKINDKIIMIIDNNGYGVLTKDKKSNDVSIKNFNFSLSSGGGKGIANYTPSTLIRN